MWISVFVLLFFCSSFCLWGGGGVSRTSLRSQKRLNFSIHPRQKLVFYWSFGPYREALGVKLAWASLSFDHVRLLTSLGVPKAAVLVRGWCMELPYVRPISNTKWLKNSGGVRRHFGSKKCEFLDESSTIIDIFPVFFEPKWSPRGGGVSLAICWRFYFGLLINKL